MIGISFRSGDILNANGNDDLDEEFLSLLQLMLAEQKAGAHFKTKFFTMVTGLEEHTGLL
jgi:hypothetical protein